jgi:hypothetical protein
MYYYGTRNDSKQQLLMTSYEKKKQRDQFVKGEAKLFDGVRYIDIEKGTVRESDNLESGESNELVIRSYLNTRQAGEGTSSGRFEVFAPNGESWKPTGFRAERYGAANTLMKALAPIFGKVIVVDHSPEMMPASSNQETYSGDDLF